MPKIVDHEARREEIVRAAFRVIRAKGVAGATIRDIAREAGTSVGAVVHYIPSKDDLLLQAADYSAKLVRERMDRAEKMHAGLRALRRVLHAALPLDDEMVGHWELWFGFCHVSVSSERIRAAMRQRYDMSYQRYARLIRAGQKAGEIPANVSIADVTTSLLRQIDGMGLHALLGSDKLSPRKLRKQIDLWIDRMLQPVVVNRVDTNGR